MTRRSLTRHGLRPRHEELGHFLLSRRAKLSPADVGMPVAGRRRTPGLRREEVAVLAGVGVSWYTWLEQGRDINISEEVLNAISGALRLDEPERAYLHRLVGMNPSVPDVVLRVPERAELQPVVDGWLPNPAYVTDRYWNVAAANLPACRVFGIEGDGHNLLGDFFLNDTAGDRPGRGPAARRLVARFRCHAGRFAEDPRFASMVERLCRESGEFAELWDLHEVMEEICGVEVHHHPELGEFVFDFRTLVFTDRADLRVALYIPAPGTEAAGKLRRLAA
jgi:transcriptional regulator with XRE-family HTH domain